jgi:MFS family permease
MPSDDRAAPGARRATSARGAVVLVGVVWVTLAFAYGLFFSFSVFFVPLIAEFRWSRGLTAGAMSVSAIVQGLCAPLAGVVADRFGPRPVILGGVVMLASAAMLAATIRAPWQLYLYTGVLSALGLVAVGWVPTSLLLSRWFHANRGRMAGIAFSGMGFGVLVIGPVTQWLIATSSWRTATLLLGLASLLLLVPLVLWGIRDPVAAPGGPDDARAGETRSVGGRALAADGRGTGTGEARRASAVPSERASPVPVPRVRATDATVGDALRTRAFWALFAAYFFTPLAVFPVATHAVAFTVDHGYPAMWAASAFGAMGLMSTVGRVAFGFAADRFGGAPTATLSYACTAGGTAALLALELLPGAGWLVAFATLFGLGFGARGPIITAMASEWFGGRRFGVIYGILNLGNGVAGAIGPWFGGFVHDVTGSYRVAFLAAIVFAACGTGCFWLARRPAS